MTQSSVHVTLSSLKTCQADIGTGMDTITAVALDLVETRGNLHALPGFAATSDQDLGRHSNIIAAVLPPLR